MLDGALKRVDREEVSDPRDCLDFLCVVDLGTWTPLRMPFIEADNSGWVVNVAYMAPLVSVGGVLGHGHISSPLGRFLSTLLRRLASVDPTLAGLATYFQKVGLTGIGGGEPRSFQFQEIPDELRDPLF